MAAPRHAFDGEPLTVAEIAARLCISTTCVRHHLVKGHNTTKLVLENFNRLRKPTRQLHYGRRAPHTHGGPAPVPPTPIR